MEGTGRKKAAGSWVRWEMLTRIVSAGMLAMAAFGFGIGFMLRGPPALDALDQTIATWGVVAMMSLVCGALYVFGGRIESTWRAGWDAERRVGDLIERAIVEAGCAFAHDVKEALGGSGNVDHVVMTPVGVWVVETKAHWLSPRRFPAALGQAANNARRVRHHLKTPLPVRAALVIAERADGPFERDHDWEGGGEGVRCDDVLARAARRTSARSRRRALCRYGKGGAHGLGSGLVPIPRHMRPAPAWLLAALSLHGPGIACRTFA